MAVFILQKGYGSVSFLYTIREFPANNAQFALCH